LLNHLIHELLPAKGDGLRWAGDGLRWANSDPITGQAAWFDLRVSLKKIPPQDASAPDTGTQKSPVGTGPTELRYGQNL